MVSSTLANKKIQSKDFGVMLTVRMIKSQEGQFLDMYLNMQVDQ